MAAVVEEEGLEFELLDIISAADDAASATPAPTPAEATVRAVPIKSRPPLEDVYAAGVAGLCLGFSVTGAAEVADEVADEVAAEAASKTAETSETTEAAQIADTVPAHSKCAVKSVSYLSLPLHIPSNVLPWVEAHRLMMHIGYTTKRN
jgi:hypothetical protein